MKSKEEIVSILYYQCDSDNTSLHKKGEKPRFYLIKYKSRLVGDDYYLEDYCPIRAYNAKDAVFYLRLLGRVKETCPESVEEVQEIDESEFQSSMEVYLSNPFHYCTSLYETKHYFPEYKINRLKLFA
jgi:hypothetical protein